MSRFRHSNCWDVKQNAKGDKMAKPIWRPLPKNHPIFKEGRFYTYTPKKPHKLNKEKNNLINASKKEKEVAK